MKFTKTKKLFITLTTFIVPTAFLVSCAYSPVLSNRKIMPSDNVSTPPLISNPPSQPTHPEQTKPNNPLVPNTPPANNNPEKPEENPSKMKENDAKPEVKTPVVAPSNLSLKVDLKALEKQRQDNEQELKSTISDYLSYNIKQISSSIPLKSFTEQVHSFNIPAIKKLPNELLIINSDAREYNWNDSFNITKQVSKISADEAKTWSDLQTIVKVGGGKHNSGIAVDGSFITVEDAKDPSKNKLMFIFDITQPDFSLFNWYKKPHNEIVNSQLRNWRRFYIFNSTTDTTNYANGTYTSANDNYLAKPIIFNGQTNWWKIYKLPFNIDYSQVKETSNLIDTKIYVDNNYNSQTRTITGNVYKNLEAKSSTLDKNTYTFDQDLKPYLDGSIYDFADIRADVSNQKLKKYAFDGGLQLYSLESYDNGQTWTNLNDINMSVKNDDGTNQARYYGGLLAGVGNGIQLKHQQGENAELNGALFFPVYWFINRNPSTSGENRLVQQQTFIFSKDLGKTWHLHDEKANLNSDTNTEATINEDEKGNIYTNQRNLTNYPKVMVSNDGLKTQTQVAVKKETSQSYNTYVAQGFLKITANNKDYFLISAPQGPGRIGGKIFLYQDDFTNKQTIFEVTPPQKPFLYSALELLYQKDNYIEFALTYVTNDDKSTIANLTDGFSIHVERYGLYLRDPEKFN